jgi:hypothetical protein
VLSRREGCFLDFAANERLAERAVRVYVRRYFSANIPSFRLPTPHFYCEILDLTPK